MLTSIQLEPVLQLLVVSMKGQFFPFDEMCLLSLSRRQGSKTSTRRMHLVGVMMSSETDSHKFGCWFMFLAAALTSLPDLVPATVLEPLAPHALGGAGPCSRHVSRHLIT